LTPKVAVFGSLRVLASGDRNTHAGRLLADALCAQQRNQEVEIERQPYMRRDFS
jgi:hypothetical protein